MKKLSDKDVGVIVNSYTQLNMNMSQIRRKYGYSLNIIKKYLLEHSVNIRDNSVNSQKYSFNHMFFDNIDSEKKAYWLGFMYADGHIVSNQPQLSLTLSSADRGHIVKFDNDISSNYPIKDYHHHNNHGEINNYSRLIISNKHFYNSCINKGLYPRKTEIVSFPSFLTNNLQRHFIRGYIDGDGSITTNGKVGKIAYKIRICGTKNMLTEIHKIFRQNNLLSNPTKNITLNKRHDNNVDNYDTTYGGNIQTKRILTYLYKDCTVYLDRKFEIANKIIL